MTATSAYSGFKIHEVFIDFSVIPAKAGILNVNYRKIPHQVRNDKVPETSFETVSS